MGNQDEQDSYAIEIAKALKQINTVCITVSERAMEIEDQIPKEDNDQLKVYFFKMTLIVGAMLALTVRNQELIDKNFPVETPEILASDAARSVH